MHCYEAPIPVSAFAAVEALDRRPAAQLVVAAYTPGIAVLAAGRPSCRVAVAGCAACPAVALIVPLAAAQRAALQASRRRIRPRRRSRRQARAR